MNKKELIPFGNLIKPHGLKGYTTCKFFNPDSKLLVKHFKIFFDKSFKNFLTIESVNYSSKNIILKFFEIDGRDKIELYRNTLFYICSLDLPKLTNDINYYIDYIGSSLYDLNNDYIGIIKDIIPIKNNDVLVYENHNKEKYLPFAKELILFFDKNSKKLKMDLIENTV